MLIAAFFKNDGALATGLIPTISVIDVNSGTTEITDASMTEIGSGLYKYEFSGFDETEEYFFICDGGDTLADTDRYAISNSGTTGQISQILDDTAEVQEELADGGRLDLIIDDIQERTDLLPDDPASGSAITTAISTSKSTITTAISTTESNIRGADSDTLEILSGQLDTIDTVADTIQAKTDNLPDDPASEDVITTAISSSESNIRGADSDTLEALSDQIDSIETKTDTIDTVVDAIKLQTDYLPTDPASESTVTTAISDSESTLTTAISTTESNIRGADSDSLETLSDQIDSVTSAANTIDTVVDGISTDLSTVGDKIDIIDTVVDTIQVKTDNLPDDPTSEASVTTAISSAESTITTAITTAETNIRGADSDTLETLSDHLDTIEGKTDIIDTVADVIQERTDLLPDDPASQATTNTAISDSESNIRGGDSDTLGILSGQLNSNYSAIASIQNNTTRRIDIPTRLVVPDSGADAVTYRFILGIYDTTGNPEVPDETPTVQVENISGTKRLAATAMTQYLADDGETAQDGQYYYDYAVADTETLEKLIVTVKLVEDAVTTYHRRTTEVTEFEADLTEIQADVTEIKAKTDCLPSDTATEITTVQDQLTTAQSTLDDAAVTLSTINTAVETSEANIKDLLENAAYGLSALKTLLDAIDTNDESTARFDEIKGSGWTSETLVQLDTLLDAIKAMTDYLPADTAQELTDIDTELVATRERTDRLPDDPADHSVVINAVSQAETNIRGGDETLETLKTQATTHDTDMKTVIADHDTNIETVITTHDTDIKTALDTHDSDIKSGLDTHDTGVHEQLDIVQGATDNLTGSPADQTAIETAIAQAEENIRGGDETLQTFVSRLNLHDSNIEGVVEAMGASIMGSQEKDLTLLSNELAVHDEAVQGGSDEVIEAIALTEANIRGGDETLETLKDRQERAQTDLTFIKNIEGGMWKIKGTQMIFYADDNTTEIARFNLFDANGQESATSVYERQRV